MILPQFPESRPLDLADKPRFDAAFAAEPPEISEFTFTNLYSWRWAYNFRVSMLDDFIVLSSNRDGEDGFFEPIGAGERSPVFARLAQESIAFVRIPEKDSHAVAAATGFAASLDRDNADYLYSSRELTELKGKRFDGKRNLIRKFKRHHAYEYVRLDGAASRDCLEFEDFWCVVKDCESEKGLSEERDAVREMCHNFSAFGLCGGAIRTGGKILAVAIGERLNPATLVMHVLKAAADIPGLYQVMHNEFLAHEARGYEYVNMEQDLGIEGLRKSKLSYQPVRIIDKYTFVPAAVSTNRKNS